MLITLRRFTSHSAIFFRKAGKVDATTAGAGRSDVGDVAGRLEAALDKNGSSAKLVGHGGTQKERNGCYTWVFDVFQGAKT
jgi:hypothetical protein